MAITRPLTLLLVLAVAGPGLAKRRRRHKPSPPPVAAPVTPAPTEAPKAPPADVPLAQSPAPAPVLTPKAPPRPRYLRVMVGTLKQDPDIPEKVGRFVSQALVQELRKLEHLQVSSAADIDEMLSFEEQKRLVGCTDEVCLSEIVSAMGVDQLVTGSLSSTANSHILTLNRLDVAGAKTLGTVTRQLERKDGEEFLAAVGGAVETLFPDIALKPGVKRGVSPEVARRLNPPPLPRWSFWAVAATSVAVAGGGAVAALSSNDAANQFQTLAAQSLTAPVSGAQLVQLSDTATSRAHLANTLFIASGGIAVAAGVMAFFTDWSPATAPEKASARPSSVAITPGDGSGAVAVSWRLP